MFPVFLLIAALLTVSSLKGVDFNKEVKHQKQKTERAKSSEKGKHAELNNVSFEAVIPFVNLELSQDLYLIYVKTFLNCLYVELDVEEPLYISKYFKNLFLFVICVNAP